MIIVINFIKWIFRPNLNIFDVFIIIVIANLAASISLWLLLMFFPFIVLSSYIEQKLGVSNA